MSRHLSSYGKALGLSVALCGALLQSQNAAAQALNANTLKIISGMTDTQRAMANAIDEVCPDLAAASFTGSPEQRLRASCTLLISSKNNSGNVFDLDMTDDQIRTAMERYGGKENVGTGSVATNNPGSDALLSRFLQLHRGATGFNLANSTLDVDGRRTSFAELAGQTGGAAGEESGAGSGWGGFANVTYGSGEKDTTARETGFDYSSWNVAAGADYRLNDNLVGGVALSLARVDSDFALALGDTKDDVWSLSFYGTYYLQDTFYVDAHVGYSRHSFDTARRIVVGSNNVNPGLDTTATSDGVAGNQVSAFVGGGYTLTSGATTITPNLNLAYLKLDIDSFSESEPIGGMALHVEKQSVDSLQSSVGVRISHSISSSSGVIVPTAHIGFVHEFANKSRSIAARFVNDPFNTSFVIPSENPDRNFFSAGAGISAVFGGGVTGFLSYDTVIGLKDVSNHVIGAGIRAEW